MKSFRNVLAILLAAACTFSLAGCLKYTGNILEFTVADSDNTVTQAKKQDTEVTTGINATTTEVQTTVSGEVTTAVPVSEVTTAAPVNEVTTAAPVTEATTAGSTDPSGWSKAEILAYVTKAVNNTKAYTGSVSVHHVENFNFTVTDCPGGSTVMNLANKIIGKVADPTDETLKFSGGKATNSEGESVVMLLPQKSNFSLPDAGVASATASASGDNTIVKIELVAESADMTSKPPYNSGVIGYLDLSTVDLSGITISAFDVKYTGSSVTYTINSQGYVAKADYMLPMSMVASGKMALISADISVEGYENEIWEINW